MLAFFFLLLSSAWGSFVNERVVRVIDLTSQVEKQIVKAEITNDGRKAQRIYYFPIPESKRRNLAFHKAVDSDTNELSARLIDSMPQTETQDHLFLEITLLDTIPTDTKTTLTITLVFIHVLQMLPAKIAQKENQYVVYQGNRFCDSVYFTKKQHTKIMVASETIKSYTKDGRESLTGKKLKYGTYENIDPFQFKPVRVHFRNNNPFLTFTEVHRDMEVSHWGNVRMSESYVVRHDGAQLVGPYESEDAMRRMYGGKLAEPSAVRELKATLPAGASRVTYTDRIGNISTSHFRNGRKKSTLEIELRYKLLGGWKTDFLITYDNPASEFISVQKGDSTHYVFNASFGMPFNKPIASQVRTSVALPEGAYDIKVSLPFDVDEEGRDVRYTYLDSQIGGGRPVVYFVKTNVIREHFESFQISYRYLPYRIYYKPVLVVTMFFLAFMFASFLNRLDLSLKDNISAEDVLRASIEGILSLDTNAAEDELHKRLTDLVADINDAVQNGKMKKGEDILARQKKDKILKHKGKRGLNVSKAVKDSYTWAKELRSNLKKTLKKD